MGVPGANPASAGDGRRMGGRRFIPGRVRGVAHRATGKVIGGINYLVAITPETAPGPAPWRGHLKNNAGEAQVPVFHQAHNGFRARVRGLSEQPLNAHRVIRANRLENGLLCRGHGSFVSILKFILYRLFHFLHLLYLIDDPFHHLELIVQLVNSVFPARALILNEEGVPVQHAKEGHHDKKQGSRNELRKFAIEAAEPNHFGAFVRMVKIYFKRLRALVATPVAPPSSPP